MYEATGYALHARMTARPHVHRPSAPVLLDVRTLFAAMFAAFLVFDLTLAVSRRSLADCIELGTWTWGAWAMVLAFVLLSLRVVAPEWISIVGGNALMFVGVHLQSQAL